MISEGMQCNMSTDKKTNRKPSHIGLTEAIKYSEQAIGENNHKFPKSLTHSKKQDKEHIARNAIERHLLSIGEKVDYSAQMYSSIRVYCI